jgi:hypothetical protein
MSDVRDNTDLVENYEETEEFNDMKISQSSRTGVLHILQSENKSHVTKVCWNSKPDVCNPTYISFTDLTAQKDH